MTKNRIVTWDTDHDITDLVDELNDAMASVFDGRQCPRMTAVCGARMVLIETFAAGRAPRH